MTLSFGAMQKLVRGIHQFQKGYFATHRELFENLATAGQRPETLFITCSDSRVIPELITSAPPGELFMVRNVGNIVPRTDLGQAGGVSAAIEFAVELLEVQQIIVCGHTQCGAVQAILNPASAEKLPFVRRWLENSRGLSEIVERRYAHLDGEARLTAAVEENVLQQLENLRTFSFVRDRLDAGELRLSGWVFKISTGEVFDYDVESEQFVRLAP